MSSKGPFQPKAFYGSMILCFYDSMIYVAHDILFFLPYIFIRVSSGLFLDIVSVGLIDPENLDHYFCSCVVADKDLRSFLKSFQQSRMLKNLNKKGGMKFQFYRIQTKESKNKTVDC